MSLLSCSICRSLAAICAGMSAPSRAAGCVVRGTRCALGLVCSVSFALTSENSCTSPSSCSSTAAPGNAGAILFMAAVASCCKSCRYSALSGSPPARCRRSSVSSTTSPAICGFNRATSRRSESVTASLSCVSSSNKSSSRLSETSSIWRSTCAFVLPVKRSPPSVVNRTSRGPSGP